MSLEQGPSITLVCSKKIGMALSATTSTGSYLIFPAAKVLSNVSVPYCSYYTSASNYSASPTAAVFLSNINFAPVYANIQAGLSNITVLASSNIGYSNSPELTAYINTLQSQVSQLGFIANCVTEQTGVTEELYAAKKRLDLSKERYEILKSPETHVSNYEGTFPIYRPIGQSTLFILFGVGLFLMLLSLVLFLRTQGIELQLVLPQTMAVSGIFSLFQGQGMYIGTAAVIGIVLGYLLHIYYK